MHERETAYPIPTSAPVYHESDPQPLPNGRIYALLDSAFAVFGLALTFWFAGILLLSSFSITWRSLIVLVVFWTFLTYLALPRMHQLFTTLYLPDYFIARTKTEDGLLGDPVNLALRGAEQDIHAAMRRAGWIQADEITFRSSLGIAKSTLTRSSYPEAPVSDLFLFGRRHDFAYQQEVDGSATRRHHVRFWHVPEGWSLPGGDRVDWLASGTYDKGVGLSTLTLQVTHKIDANTDAERDYIIDTVRFIDPECDVEVINQFSPAFHDRNGGGDSIQTDGQLPILIVNDAAQRAEDAGVEFNQEHTDLIGFKSEQLDHHVPPKSLAIVGGILALRLLLITAAAVIMLLPGDIGLDFSEPLKTDTTLKTAEKATEVGPSTMGLELIMLGVGLAILIALYILTVRRHRWARLFFLVVASMTALTGLLDATADHSNLTVFQLTNTGLSILIVLALSSPAVREWVDTIRRRGGDMPVGH